VARVEYQPGIVELSTQAMPVPADASVSKFSVSGTPGVVMLPPLVIANDGSVIREDPAAMQIKATAIAETTGRRVAEGRRDDGDLRVVFIACIPEEGARV
jgi:hypothetical protein